MWHSSRYVFSILLACSITPARGDDFASLKGANWHQWRGPDATGVAAHATPPLTWDADTNVAWKVRIPGLGNASPIVWGDRVFVLTAVDTGRADPALPKPEDQPERPFGITYPNSFHQYVVLCLDRSTGRELWRQVAAERIPNEGHHGDNSFASASPTTDGERLYAWFGSAGMFCYSLNGDLIWKRDLGPVRTRLSFGEGASPVVHAGRVVINRDHEGDSSIIVLDAGTGETLWQQPRLELSGWATPLITQHNGRTQVIVNASNRVRSYDLSDGTLIWECGGQVSNVTPSPVRYEDEVICMSGYRGSAAQAIPLNAQGDITGTDEIAWKLSQGTPYIPSPLLYDGLLYFNQSNNNVLTCVDAATGEIVIERTRMPRIQRLYASPVGAAGRVYFVGRDGTTIVIERGREFSVLATNSLGENVDASPALVGNQLFLRGKEHLYCIAE